MPPSLSCGKSGTRSAFEAGSGIADQALTERSRAQARSRPRQLLYQPETTNKCLKDPENQSPRSASYERRSAAMIETGRGRELQNKIERYRALEREVRTRTPQPCCETSSGSLKRASRNKRAVRAGQPQGNAGSCLDARYCQRAPPSFGGRESYAAAAITTSAKSCSRFFCERQPFMVAAKRSRMPSSNAVTMVSCT